MPRTTGDGKALGQLVDAIYDCVFQPDNWPAVLDRIQRDAGAHSSYLLIHDTNPHSPEIALLIENNVDTQMRRLYQEHYVGLNPLLPHLASFGEGEVYSCRHLVTQPEYLHGEFYREWAEPQDWFDYAGVTMIRQDQTSAAIGFTRAGRGNVFDDASLNLFRRLAPHLARAARIMQLMEREARSRRDLAGLIERARYGVLIVDAEARVIETNPVAASLLARKDGLASKGRTLTAGEATALLHGAIREACGRRSDYPARRTVRVNRVLGRRPLVLQIVPFRVSESPARLLALLPARAAVFVIDPESEPRGAIEIMAEAYHLTAAERQVLDHLASGESPAATAAALNVRMPTVRTHLHRIFAKTGTRRQSELLTLLPRFAPPIVPD